MKYANNMGSQDFVIDLRGISQWTDNVGDGGSNFLEDKTILSLKIKQLKSDKNLVEIKAHTVERLLHMCHVSNLTRVSDTIRALKT